MVTITIAVLCIAVFAWTGVLNAGPANPLFTPEVATFAEEHPYLFDEEGYEGERPDPAQLAAERKELEALVARNLEQRGGPERALSLVPSRGFAQVGWVTNLFVHFDLFHLLGNLLFLWIVGPLLEEAWGRWRFLLFYFAAGLFASLVQFGIDRHSIASIGGASGAIAGCMGAFALRFALTKIRFHYFLWFIRIMVGEVHVPAWLCGVLWLGRELFDLKDGGATGVATGAHVGGFMIGGLVAVGMKALGRDSELLTVAESDERNAERDQLFMEASTALARGDAELAREYALSLQAQAPHYPGLAMLQAEADVRANRGVARLEKVLRPMLAKKDGEVERLVSRLWPSLQPEGFSAAFAWQLAERLRDARPPVDSDIPEALLRHVAAGSGSLAIKARALLEPAAPPTPRVLPAKLVTVSREGLQFVVEGAPKLVPFAAVGAVLGGIVPEEGRRALFVDVVLKAPGARTALRLSGSDPAVPPLFPGKPVPEAWRAFIEATRRAANVQPDAAPWAEFSSAEALTDSWGT